MMDDLKRMWLRMKQRRRLKRILKATGIRFELTPWQEDYILKERPSMPQGVMDRRTGKTLAVILRCLVWDPVLPVEVLDHLKRDPDTWSNRTQTTWTWREYERYASACRKAGIKLRCTDLSDAGLRRALLADQKRWERIEKSVIYSSRNRHG